MTQPRDEHLVDGLLTDITTWRQVREDIDRELPPHLAPLAVTIKQK